SRQKLMSKDDILSAKDDILRAKMTFYSVMECGILNHMAKEIIITADYSITSSLGSILPEIRDFNGALPMASTNNFS
ncbi:hypothetical protein WUBG_17121, partial [Wuchereria bancrofti]